MKRRVDADRAIGLALVAAGSVSLANPAWLGAVTIYPGTGWGFLPLFHAMLSAFGLLAIAAGLFALRAPRWPPSRRQLVALAVGTIVAVPLYARILAMTIGTDGAAINGYEYRQAFVASLLVATFVAGCATATRRRALIRLALAVPVVPTGFVLLEWRSGALLEPVLEGHFLLTGAPIGVPYLGPATFVAAFTLGFWAGQPSSTAGGRSPASSGDSV
ncbi:hypothetical protein [Natronococcus pandeyae]|nr:hypothetical protein [Natronococcus pandeyae]